MAVTGSTVRDDEAMVLAVVRALVSERHTVERAASVTLDSGLDRDLGLDSLAVAELLARVEDTAGVSFDPGVLGTVTTPRDVVAAIELTPATARGRRAAVRRPAPAPVQDVPEAAATLNDALSWHVGTHPERTHLRILGAGEEELSYGDLHRAATEVAAGLLTRDLRPGERVGIMLPTGRDYFASFLGVLLAGGVPVPLYPPARPAQLAEHLRRQAGILANAQAAVLIAAREAAPLARLLRGHVDSMRHLVHPAQLAGHGGPVPPAAPHGPDLAMLQYTSGSTGDPKGVMLTHTNLLANIRAMGQAVQVGAGDVFVSWLPLYHDMGLIGAWLSSLYFGMPLVVMPPTTFLARPSRWLWAIHTHRGTLTAAPNFAYELCLRKIGDAELEGLDLRSLRMAFNGAEPVNPDTPDRFAARFGPYGLRAEALSPVYGLAENSVGLTFPPPGRQASPDRISRTELSHRGLARPVPADDPDAVRFMPCGRALPGHEVRVVDADGRQLGERVQGVVEFRGPSATAGYFRNPEATAALLRHGWLDTGDLGYLDRGELYVTGRVKDLIIKAGRNLHPEELERAVGDLPGVRKGNVAVFATTDQTGGTERLVILAETRLPEQAHPELRNRIVGVAVDLLEAPPDEVVLALPGTVLKTSSGKIRRAATRSRYEQGRVGRSRPPWWQVAGFAVRGLRPLSLRLARALAAVAFAAWCWLCLVAVGVPTLIALAVTRDLAGRRHLAGRAAKALARLTRTAVTVEGGDRLARLTDCVVVANHASYLDGFAMSAALPGPLTFVAGEIFAHKPLIGFLLRRIGTRFVERTDRAHSVADARLLDEVARLGGRLVIFAEGSLAPRPGLRPFHMGAFTIAAHAGLPVVPIAIRGTRDMMRPDHGALIRRGHIRLLVDEPISPAGTGWGAAVALEHQARAAIARDCGEPDLGD